MKHNKLLTLSLLVSFLILTSASLSLAVTITYDNVNSRPYPAGATVQVPVYIDNDALVSAADLVGMTVGDGNVSMTVTGVNFDVGDLADPAVLNDRYGIQDLGGGKFRLGAIKTLPPPDGADLPVGNGQVATLICTFNSNCKLGTADIEPTDGMWNGHPVETAVIYATGLPATLDIVNGAVNVVNEAPFFTNCPTAPLVKYWAEGAVVYSAAADDHDIPCGCDVLNYSKIEGPGGMAGNVWSWDPTGADVGCNTVKVQVKDFYNATAVCEFDVHVLNEKPEITCPDDGEVIMGSLFTATVTATDPDGGPLGLTYSLGAGNQATGATIGGTSGVFEWTAPDDCGALGDYVVEVIVSDGATVDECNLVNADTCEFIITVKPSFRVVIEYDDGPTGMGVTQGHFHDLDVYLEGPPNDCMMEMAGYDFLISYEHSLGALTFISAEMGDMLVQGHWEYFTFRFGPFGNCGSACPSGLVRLTAMAEINNGVETADGFDNSGGFNVLAVMKVLVSNDRTYNCIEAPVEWFWIDCGDNTISSRYGDTLFLERFIYDREGDLLPEDPPEGYDLLPGYWGVGDDCLEEYKTIPIRGVDYKNGGFKIICSDDIDAPGDININGIPYEIADAVMYTRYFVEGLEAFAAHVEASIAASDVNADGITLSVADLVYLIRVIQGDALGYPKPTPGADDINVATQLIGGDMAVTYDATANVGGMLMIFNVNGSVGEPKLADGAAGMDMIYRPNGNELRVLIYNSADGDPAYIKAGTNNLVNIPVEGTLELRSVEAADFFGSPMNASVRVLPTEFDLAQNYPNPFNPFTTVKLDLPVASQYSVAIYNVAGQLIRNFSGYAEAGTVEIVWDGKDASGNQVASGVYFYKSTARDFSATKKMILMK
jgi:hypothetical protein